MHQVSSRLLSTTIQIDLNPSLKNNLFPVIAIMRKLLLLFGVCLFFVEVLLVRPVEKKEKEFPHSLEKSCNFAIRLYKTVASKFIGNMALAPFSAFDSLFLLSHGAEENTAKQIRQVLNVVDNSEDLTHHQLFTKNLTDPENPLLNFVQVLYISDEIEVSPTFKQLSSSTFITQHKSLNFHKPEEAISAVNKYFAKRTNKRDPSLDPINFPLQSSDMFIRNSLEFSAQFLYPFNERYTEKRSFFRNVDDKSLVTTMSSRGRFRGVIIPPTNKYLDTFRVIEIPFKIEEYSMLIYYPLNSYKLNELEQRLDTFNFRSILNSRKEDIQLYLPKFDIQNEQRLKLTLTKMGVLDAFDRSANFTRISKKPLHLDEIYIRTYFSVTEHGINVNIQNNMNGYPLFATALPHSKPLTIEVNKPFMFSVIKKEEDDFMCLFNGRVYNPQVLPMFF